MLHVACMLYAYASREPPTRTIIGICAVRKNKSRSIGPGNKPFWAHLPQQPEAQFEKQSRLPTRCILCAHQFEVSKCSTSPISGPCTAKPGSFAELAFLFMTLKIDLFCHYSSHYSSLLLLGQAVLKTHRHGSWLLLLLLWWIGRHLSLIILFLLPLLPSSSLSLASL